MREVRYWHSKPFRQTYGRDRASKGFPRQDAEGYFLTMGYRIQLDDGQPEDGEPSPEPSRATGRARPSPPRDRPRPEGAPRPQAPARPAERPDPQNSYRRFGHAGGFDGFEGRMATSEPGGSPRPKSGHR
ncbi:hypothetical protein [Methylobacterium durans]|uniref:Uncharacterized protein n=1 Tax=Methylobacterium durans TaxID=2202825 RepID=A0A2U8W670_9HYPH|nr:hypothetical protein [Methylobacterium durans]AWN41539.1 hypothetical protein DK389_14745 [Methylobacterium durans]